MVRPPKVVVREKEGEDRPVGRSGDEGVKKVRWGTTVSGEQGEGVRTHKVGSVDVSVMGEGGRKTGRRMGEYGNEEAASAVVTKKGAAAVKDVVKGDAGGILNVSSEKSITVIRH